MDNNQHKKTSSHRHSIFGPLILIAIGVAFLLQNMGVISGDFWDIVLSLWPLLIIFAGVDSLVRREGVAWPTLLIIVGAFFLLKNFNIVNWHGWGSLWKLWPLILVAIGVDLIFKNRPLWVTIFGVVMAVIVVVGEIWLVGFSTQAGVGSPAEA